MKNMTPLMAINYIRKSVGYNAYLAEYARFRKIQEEEFTQSIRRTSGGAKRLIRMRHGLIISKNTLKN